MNDIKTRTHVEVFSDMKQVLDEVNEKTKIPYVYIIDNALKRGLRSTYRKKLSTHSLDILNSRRED